MIKVRNMVGTILLIIVGGLVLNTVDPGFLTKIEGHKAVYKDEGEQKRKRYEVEVEYNGRPAHTVSITVMISADVTDVKPGYEKRRFHRSYHNRRAGDKVTIIVITAANVKAFAQCSILVNGEVKGYQHTQDGTCRAEYTILTTD